MNALLELPPTLGVYLSPKAKELGIELPERRYVGDGGYDFRTIEPVVVEPGKVGHFPTGSDWNLPGHDMDSVFHVGMLVLPRTGLAAGKGLYPMAWLVDCGFRANDENGLTLALRNLGQERLEFEVGDRVAQGILVPLWTPRLVSITADKIDKTDRGGNKLGSTGIK